MKYVIVIEPTGTGYSAYLPDLPGCVATGADKTEVLKNMREALDFHLEGLVEQGLPVPNPSCMVDVVEVPAP